MVMLIARRLGVWVWWTAVENARELVLLMGLILLHVGLRELRVQAPGAAWYGPGLILTGIAIFGVRGGQPRPPRKEQ